MGLGRASLAGARFIRASKLSLISLRAQTPHRIPHRGGRQPELSNLIAEGTDVLGDLAAAALLLGIVQLLPNARLQGNQQSAQCLLKLQDIGAATP